MVDYCNRKTSVVGGVGHPSGEAAMCSAGLQSHWRSHRLAATADTAATDEHDELWYTMQPKSAKALAACNSLARQFMSNLIDHTGLCQE